MSDGGIDLQTSIQTPGIIEINLDLPVTLPLPTPDAPISTNGTENGAIYFNLEWQNSRAEDRRQQISFGLPDLNPATTFEPDATSLFPKTLENTARESNNINDIDDGKIVRIKVQTDSTNLPTEISLSDGEESLENPARFDQTFEPNTFQNFRVIFDGARPDVFPTESAPENELFFDRRENLPDSSALINADSKSPVEKSNGNIALPPTEDAFGRTIAANSVVVADVKILPESKNPKDIAFEKGSKVLPGNIGNGLLIENGVTRTSGTNVSDNALNNAAVRRGGGGTAVGGALISGALKANDNYKNLESRDINRSRFVGEVGGAGHKSLAAGATGIMMSAAIGNLSPNTETKVSGILGAISGAVVGVETEQGMRFLAANQSSALPEKSAVSNFALQTSFA